jgi:NADH dehydrogenase
MPSEQEMILVVGATGLLGGHVTRALLARGHAVRALVRDLSKADFPGAELVPGDLLDPVSLAAATRGASQVFTTANSFMGRGANSPTRVDVAGYRSLLSAARDAGVGRIVHVSSDGLTADSEVDFFRVKYQVEEAVRAGGIPWVVLRPSAFMDIWCEVYTSGIGKNGTATVFGDGRARANFIAVADVAEFSVRILERPEIRNEVIPLGGPSTISALEFVDLVARRAGKPVKVRHVPMAVLRFIPPLVRPFNELAARLMTIGRWSASRDRPMDHWREGAERLGHMPMTLDEWLEKRAR